VPTISDDTRYSNARAASHGYGAGQIEASRLVGDWSSKEFDRHATEILKDTDQAQAYAQDAPTYYDEFAQRMSAGGVEPTEQTKVAYEAGFDIGFSAALVHGCEALMGQGTGIRMPEEAGAQGLEDVASRL